jgi:hypothetical protein
MWDGGRGSRYDTALQPVKVTGRSSCTVYTVRAVHKTIYGPLIDTALYEMLLMRVNLLLGKVGGGRAQPPPTCPRNGFTRIKLHYVGGPINNWSINS